MALYLTLMTSMNLPVRAVQRNFGELVYIQLAANINNGRRMEFNDALLAKLLQTKGSGQKVSFFHSTHPASTPQTVHEDITSALADGRVDTLVLPAFRRTADTVRDEPDQAIVLQLVDDSVTACSS